MSRAATSFVRRASERRVWWIKVLLRVPRLAGLRSTGHSTEAVSFSAFRGHEDGD